MGPCCVVLCTDWPTNTIVMATCPSRTVIRSRHVGMSFLFSSFFFSFWNMVCYTWIFIFFIFFITFAFSSDLIFSNRVVEIIVKSSVRGLSCMCSSLTCNINSHKINCFISFLFCQILNISVCDKIALIKPYWLTGREIPVIFNYCK